MPILKKETKEITLPESGAKLSIYTKFSYGDILEIQSQEIKDNNDARLEMAVLLIKDWDFTNDKNEKIEINAKNLKELSSIDGVFLIKEINSIIAEKKN